MSEAICLWFIFFSASLLSNTFVSMLKYITTNWKIMSRRFSKNDNQRMKIAKRIQEIVDDTYDEEVDFFKEMNIAAGTYGHIKKEGKFTIEFIIEFADKHHKSLNWLLRKVGRKDLTPKESKEPTD